eukprot:scaffold144613_cov130-Phaeocystis_antarctica.AAC.1
MQLVKLRKTVQARAFEANIPDLQLPWTATSSEQDNIKNAPAVAAATPRSRPRLTALARTAADCQLLGSWAGWSSAASGPGLGVHDWAG